MANGDTADPNTPLSWRDVYRAVNDSEARVVAAIQNAVAPLNLSSIDHETRLRIIETKGSPEAQEALLAIHALEVRVLATETAATLRVGRAEGVFATLGAGKSFIVLLAAVAGAVLTMIELIQRIVPR